MHDHFVHLLAWIGPLFHCKFYDIGIMFEFTILYECWPLMKPVLKPVFTFLSFWLWLVVVSDNETTSHYRLNLCSSSRLVYQIKMNLNLRKGLKLFTLLGLKVSVFNNLAFFFFISVVSWFTYCKQIKHSFYWINCYNFSRLILHLNSRHMINAKNKVHNQMQYMCA